MNFLVMILYQFNRYKIKKIILKKNIQKVISNKTKFWLEIQITQNQIE